MDTRLTKIVCTLGPSSATKAEIEALMDCGMNVARINLSHGTLDDHAKTITVLRELNEHRTCPVAILLDTKGAEIRSGDLQTPIDIAEGEQVVFCPPSVCPKDGTKCISVNYDGFSTDVQETSTILIDNGELSFDITTINDDGTVLATAREAGQVGSRRHINLPGADVDLPTITEKDWVDIDFAATQHVDYIALSFIRSADEVKAVRSKLEELKTGDIQLIAKIETQQAVDNLEEILEAADGIMVARGDLGAEIPYENIPVIQDQIVTRCNDVNKPVIVATHMLESMKEHPIPTRAEMTDVAHAASTGSDATMLSGETASGKHPCKALQAMHKLLRATETYLARFNDQTGPSIRDHKESRAAAAVDLAQDIDAVAILAFTKTGRTARQLSKFRPHIPIIACTDTVAIQRLLALSYGVTPLHVTFSSAQETIENGIAAAKACNFLESGDKIMVVSDIPNEADHWFLEQRIVN